MLKGIYISVIIPVYNAAKVIEKSFSSLLDQTYEFLEIIIINDCSSDGSLNEILKWKNELEKKEHIIVKIFSHERNQGVAVARNTGLDNATGEYIYYLDADDALECDSLRLLVEHAIENKCDIVGCNWILSFEKHHRKMNQKNFHTPWEGLEGMLTGKIRWNLWLFLVRRSLYENYNIRFIPNMDMGEDMLVMCKLFTCANNVDFLNKHLYYYNQLNSDSLTKSYNNKHMSQVTENVSELELFLRDSVFASRVQYKLDILKLNIKLPLLISNKSANYEIWNDWFKESNKYILDKNHFNFRIRLVQWCAFKRFYWINKLYYNLLVKFVYGVVYK